MRILGLDPGTATTGYSIIDKKNSSIQILDFGLIETDKNGDAGVRLVVIFEELEKLISKYKPDCLSIERLFFATNAKTVMRVGQALGVMIYCATKNSIPVFEYAPASIKKAITQNGRADKKDMQKELRKIFGAGIRSRPNKKTHFDNAADAIAIAVCHLIKTGNYSTSNESMVKYCKKK